MSDMFLTRARMKRDPSLEAVAQSLLPHGRARVAGAHRLVWSLFAGDRDSERDFLFREVSKRDSRRRSAEFLVLSRREPDWRNPLLDVETKPFTPALAAGDILSFSLRANPAVSKNDAAGKTRRHDVVMQALHAIPYERRAAERPAIIAREGLRWLERQGEQAGFRILADVEEEEGGGLRIDGYDQLQFERLGRKGRISVLDFEGRLEVTDPARFLARLPIGFGRARAYGCGLMLIRRA